MPAKRTRSTTDAQASTSQDTSITVIPDTQLSRDTDSPASTDGEVATANTVIQAPPPPRPGLVAVTSIIYLFLI